MASWRSFLFTVRRRQNLLVLLLLKALIFCPQGCAKTSQVVQQVGKCQKGHHGRPLCLAQEEVIKFLELPAVDCEVSALLQVRAAS